MVKKVTEKEKKKSSLEDTIWLSIYTLVIGLFWYISVTAHYLLLKYEWLSFNVLAVGFMASLLFMAAVIQVFHKKWCKEDGNM